jgi:hypothetical protein
VKHWLVWLLVFCTFANGEALAAAVHDEELEQFTLSDGELPGSTLAAAHQHHRYCNHTCHGAAHAVSFVVLGWPPLGATPSEQPTVRIAPLFSRSIQPPIHPPNRV